MSKFDAHQEDFTKDLSLVFNKRLLERGQFPVSGYKGQTWSPPMNAIIEQARVVNNKERRYAELSHSVRDVLMVMLFDGLFQRCQLPAYRYLTELHLVKKIFPIVVIYNVYLLLEISEARNIPEKLDIIRTARPPYLSQLVGLDSTVDALVHQQFQGFDERAFYANRPAGLNMASEDILRNIDNNYVEAQWSKFEALWRIEEKIYTPSKAHKPLLHLPERSQQQNPLITLVNVARKGEWVNLARWAIELVVYMFGIKDWDMLITKIRSLYASNSLPFAMSSAQLAV